MGETAVVSKALFYHHPQKISPEGHSSVYQGNHEVRLLKGINKQPASCPSFPTSGTVNGEPSRIWKCGQIPPSSFRVKHRLGGLVGVGTAWEDGRWGLGGAVAPQR